MKHIKLFERFGKVDVLSKKKIDSICKKCDIENYTINEDGSIDVDGSVDLGDLKLTKLPLVFRKVNGYFNCADNKLITLEGCPIEVRNSFSCSDNKLITLEGCPSIIDGYFHCDNNKLESLEGGPIEVGDDYLCFNNKLKTLKGGPIKVGGDFDFSHNIDIPRVIYQNKKYIKKILEYQEDYSIWRSDNKLDEFRFNDMMEEIKSEYIKESNEYYKEKTPGEESWIGNGNGYFEESDVLDIKEFLRYNKINFRAVRDSGGHKYYDGYPIYQIDVGLRVDKLKDYGYILSYDDEWFTFNYCRPLLPKYLEEGRIHKTVYECDQLEGLFKCIEDKFINRK